MNDRLHSLAYLCLDARREGQGCRAHVGESIHGLRRRGWEFQLFEPPHAFCFRWIPGIFQKRYILTMLQVRLCCRLSQSDVLYICAHPVTFFAAFWATLRGKNGPAISDNSAETLA